MRHHGTTTRRADVAVERPIPRSLLQVSWCKGRLVLLEECAIGLRYGDNYYNRGVSGHIRVTDSVIRSNTYAFLNYVRQGAAPKPAGYVELASTTIADRQAPPPDQWPCQDIFTTRTDVKRGEGMMEVTAEGILKHVESIVVLPKTAV